MSKYHPILNNGQMVTLIGCTVDETKSVECVAAWINTGKAPEITIRLPGGKKLARLVIPEELRGKAHLMGDGCGHKIVLGLKPLTPRDLRT